MADSATIDSGRSTQRTGQCLLAAALLTLAPVAAAMAVPPIVTPMELEYDRSPSAVVLRYIENPGELAPQAEAPPTITVYGDGRVLRKMPRHRVDAGEWQLQLSPAEVDALLRSLCKKGVADFDEAAVRGELRSAKRARRAQRSLFVSSDATTVDIELRLLRYRAGATTLPTRGLTKRIRWRALRSQARQFPEVRALRDLDDARRQLQALGERPGFRRVR